MTAMTRTATFVAADSRPLSLTEELAMLGIRSIPTEKVVAWKKRQLAERPLITKITTPFLCCIEPVLIFLSLLKPLEWLAKRCGVPLVLIVLVYFASTAVGLIGAMAGTFYLTPLAVPFLSLIVALWYSKHVSLSPFERKYLQRWSRHKFFDYNFEHTQVPVPGKHIYGRAQMARQLGEVRIDVFGVDPFLAVVRKSFLRTEVAYIAAWETGNAELDNF